MKTDREQVDRTVDLIQQALARARSALRHQDSRNAIRWFNRAHRLAPSDPAITLSLGSVLLNNETARAVALFRDVLAAYDFRDAWLGLAAGCLLLGDVGHALAALESLLTRHFLTPVFAKVVADVAQRGGAPGWCGMTYGGVMSLCAVRLGQIDVRIDDRPLGHATERDGILSTVLPRGWRRADQIEARVDGDRLIGTPIDIRSITTIDGMVERRDDVIQVSAWLPANPQCPPRLWLDDGIARRRLRLRPAAEPHPGIPAPICPWTASLSELPVARGRGAVRIVDDLDRDLPGSPVDVRRVGTGLRRSETLASRSTVRHAGPGPVRTAFFARPLVRPITVIVMRSEATDAGLRHLEIQATIPRGTPVVSMPDIDGAPNDLGTPPNFGLFDTGAVDPGTDLVILGPGAIPSRGWLERLRAAAASDSDVGVVSALSNAGVASLTELEGASLTACSPEQETRHLRSRHIEVEAAEQFDRMARRVNRTLVLSVPALSGPCVYIRGDCLSDVGPISGHGWLGVQLFGLRATARGWRLALAADVFIGQSCDGRPARPRWSFAHAHLMGSRDLDGNTLAERVAKFRRSPAFFAACRRIDLTRWRAGPEKAGSVILITHDDGGGVARRVDDAVAAIKARGLRAIVLRPAETDGDGAAVTVEDGGSSRFRWLRFTLPDEKATLNRLLRSTGPRWVELHHFLGHDPTIFSLLRSIGVPYDVHIHDYIWFCPRVALVGTGDRYCGEPELVACAACVAENGSLLGETISPSDLRDRSRSIFVGARKVIAPSADAARRVRRKFPGVRVSVVEHEHDGPSRRDTIQAAHSHVEVCVPGAIGLHKGFHVLLACARDARDRSLDLKFTVVGHTIDDAALLATGHVFITGPYEWPEAEGLIRSCNATLGFLPSIWPETWSLSLTELWRAGLDVAVFNIGAPADRVRQSGRGFVLPLGATPGVINDALIDAARN